MSDLKVLIGGFGRFPGAPFNPSGLVALALARRRRPALADVRRLAHVFAVRYADGGRREHGGRADGRGRAVVDRGVPGDA